MFAQFLDPIRLFASVRMDSRNIAARRRAAGAGWDLHLAKSRQFIIDNLPPKLAGRAVILGSGHLFDVPLDELCAVFERVVLVDVHHPKVARDAAARFSNIELVTCDITGIPKELMKAARCDLSLPAPHPPEDLLNQADFVVSLNILSQITVWPHTFLSYVDGLSDEAIGDYMGAIIQSHLDWLKTVSAQALVICDLERRTYLKDQLQSREDILFGVTLPPPEQTWNWDIAPAPIANAKFDLRHKVCAFKI